MYEVRAKKVIEFKFRKLDNFGIDEILAFIIKLFHVIPGYAGIQVFNLLSC